jgi:hypothetical protein
MSLEVFDNELDDYLEKKTNECLMCSKPIDEDKSYCSCTCAMHYNND